MTESEFFQVELDEGVARCTMRGPSMNAMGREMLPLMVEMLDEVLADEAVRVIVIRGDGGNFCTGADLSIMGDKMDPEFLNFHMLRMDEIILRLYEGAKPVICEVDGWAVGGGFGLAMASDITYATERALFMMSFVRISIIPDLGCAYLLARRVGLNQAKELALTGRVVDAEEAFRLGMVNKVFPYEDISEEVMKIARKMAGRSPEVLKVIKRHFNVAATGNVDLKTFQDLEAYAQPFFVLKPEHRRDIEKFFKDQK
jgi:2-(1,2-epoxy-1,2-dihydrophenyl)acetyl-CoA isomerase